MTTTSPRDEHRLLELVDMARGGELNAEGYAKLNALLAGNRRNQKIYLEYILLHSNLTELAVHSQYDAPVDRSKPDRTPPPIRQFLTTGFSIVLALFLMLCIRFLFDLNEWQLATPWSPHQPARIATIQRLSADADWQIDEQPQGTMVFENETVEVLEGCLELVFRNGTRLVAAGPARFTVQHDLGLTLQHGTLRATVRDGVSGLQVVTDRMTIVDLGTEFYVSAGENRVTLLYVSEGKCRVGHGPDTYNNGPQPIVTAGGCVLADRSGNLVPLGGREAFSYCEQMISRVHAFDFNLRELSPSISIVEPEQVSMTTEFSSDNRAILLIPEKRLVTLEDELVVSGPDSQPVVLPAGTTLDSYLVHYAFGENLPKNASPMLTRRVRCAGHVVFNRQVAAVVTDRPGLQKTDELFSRHDFTSIPARTADSLDIAVAASDDPHRIDLDFVAEEGDVDQVRVLVYTYRPR